MQEIGTKGKQEEVTLSGKGNTLGIVQELEIRPNW